MYNDYGNPTVIGCTFANNTVVTGDGGGMHNRTSSPTVTGCTFTGNSASNNGGGIYKQDNCELIIVSNCTFTGN